MLRRTRARALLGIALALGVLVISASPVAAERILNDCTAGETCGYWEVGDTGPGAGPAGAVCKYENGSFDLDFISIRPPLMHGAYSNKTPVEWRYKIRRQPVSGAQPFSVIYTSTWQSAMANDAIPAYAGSGFARRYWYAPENPHGFFQVLVEMRWKHSGAVEGFVRVQYEWYKALWNGNSYKNNEYCLEDY